MSNSGAKSLKEKTWYSVCRCMPCQSISSLLYIYAYVNTGVTWLITPWVTGVRSRSQVTKKGKISFNQPLIYIHSFPPPSPNISFAILQLSSQTNVLGRKNIGGGGALPPLAPTPHQVKIMYGKSGFNYTRSSGEHPLHTCDSTVPLYVQYTAKASNPYQ
jgi:hypothetical protein